MTHFTPIKKTHRRTKNDSVALTQENLIGFLKKARTWQEIANYFGKRVREVKSQLKNWRMKLDKNDGLVSLPAT